MIPLPLITLATSLLGNWQRILIYAALAATAVAVIWGHGYFKGRQGLHEYQAEQARAAVAIIVKQGAITERVVTRYVQIAGKTQTVTEYVDREVVRYAETNPGLCLDPGWRRLHDAAADNRKPDAPRPADGPVRETPAAPSRPGLAPRG